MARAESWLGRMRKILDVIELASSRSLSAYCMVALFMQWPLTNVIWFAAAMAFLYIGDKAAQRLDSNAGLF